MDPDLLRAYLATSYELPADTGALNASLDGELGPPQLPLPGLLLGEFAILTAYNPRSSLTEGSVNEARNQVLGQLLRLGCHRVEQCLAGADSVDGLWREPGWLVHSMDRQEALHFGRAFRQNAIVYSRGAQPELIVSDPSCGPFGKIYPGSWRVRN